MSRENSEQPPVNGARMRILYGPTLGSGGAYQCLGSQFAEDAFDIAIVSSGQRLMEVFPRFKGRILEVAGHVSGYRALRSFTLKAGREVTIIAGQNPCFWPAGYRDAQSVLQNTKFIQPLVALPYERGARARLRLAVSSLLTELQVRRSSQVTVLSPAYPRRWESVSKIRVVPNSLPASTLALVRMEPEPLVVFVGSTEPFRHARLAARAFADSGLAASGWRMSVHAAGSDTARSLLQRDLTGLPGVALMDAQSDPRHSLARAAIAVFPSVLEGSSIAYLEALHLARCVVALDRPHFRTASGVARRDVRVDFIDGLDPMAWAEALKDRSQDFAF